MQSAIDHFEFFAGFLFIITLACLLFLIGKLKEVRRKNKSLTQINESLKKGKSDLINLNGQYRDEIKAQKKTVQLIKALIDFPPIFSVGQEIGNNIILKIVPVNIEDTTNKLIKVQIKNFKANPGIFDIFKYSICLMLRKELEAFNSYQPEQLRYNYLVFQKGNNIQVEMTENELSEFKNQLENQIGTPTNTCPDPKIPVALDEPMSKPTDPSAETPVPVTYPTPQQ